MRALALLLLPVLASCGAMRDWAREEARDTVVEYLETDGQAALKREAPEVHAAFDANRDGVVTVKEVKEAPWERPDFWMSIAVAIGLWIERRRTSKDLEVTHARIDKTQVETKEAVGVASRGVDEQYDAVGALRIAVADLQARIKVPSPVVAADPGVSQ